MARKKAVPAPIPEIIETTKIVYEVGDDSYPSREEAQRAVLWKKICALTDTGDDSLPETDLYKDDVIDWIINHYAEIVALGPVL